MNPCAFGEFAWKGNFLFCVMFYTGSHFLIKGLIKNPRSSVLFPTLRKYRIISFLWIRRFFHLL